MSINLDSDEEEIEYLLSVLAGSQALALRLNQNAPGIVIAIEVFEESIENSFDDSVTLTAPLNWDQVQCALLAFFGEEGLTWFASQEIEIFLDEWK